MKLFKSSFLIGIKKIDYLFDNLLLFENDRKKYQGLFKENDILGKKTELQGFSYVVTFNSFSQAKKTLDSLKKPLKKIYWINSHGRIVAKAAKNQMIIDQNKLFFIPKKQNS